MLAKVRLFFELANKLSNFLVDFQGESLHTTAKKGRLIHLPNLFLFKIFF